MPKTTPFHPRLEALNQTMIWGNWSGYLAAPNYQHSVISEYYAIRNSAALLDTSPLFKYRFSGTGAQTFLEKALARDIRKCKVGQAQYTAWCDPAGYVVEDGVINHIAENEYWLTAAEPNLRHFKKLAREMGCTDCLIEEISTQYGILALQGPHSVTILRQLTDDVDSLAYFGLTQTTISNKPVTISRTWLHRRPWLRTLDQTRRRVGRLGRADGNGQRPQYHPARVDCAEDGARRSRSASTRCRLPFGPLRLGRRPARNTHRTGLGLDVPQPSPR